MLLISFYINHKKVFELVFTQDNYKKYKISDIFVKFADVCKTAEKVTYLCHISSVWHSPIRNKVGKLG